MKRIIFIIQFFILIINQQTVWAQKEPSLIPLKFGNFISLVGKNNLGYAAERFNLSIAEASIEMARMFPDPAIYAGAFDNGQRRMKMGYGFSLSAAYILEQGHKRKARINLANSQLELTKALLENYFRNLRADATIAFLDAIKKENLLAVKLNSYNSMKNLARADSIRFKLGAIMEIDARQSKVESISLLNESYKSEAEYMSSLTNIALPLGYKTLDSIYKPNGDFSKFDRDFLLHELITFALNNRADLLAALKSKNVAQNTLNLAKANRISDWGIIVGVNNTSVVTNYVAPTPSLSSVSAGISIPIKFSNYYRGALKQAEFGILQSEKIYDLVELTIQAEVNQNYYMYTASRKQVQQFNTGLLENAKKVLDGKMYSYQRGETSLLEVLNAQRTYNGVRQNYYETLFNNAAALVELERSVGIWDIEF